MTSNRFACLSVEERANSRRRRCRTCNKRSHETAECPKSRCFHCGREGHPKKACPEIKCRRCGRGGHLAAGCRSEQIKRRPAKAKKNRKLSATAAEKLDWRRRRRRAPDQPPNPPTRENRSPPHPPKTGRPVGAPETNGPAAASSCSLCGQGRSAASLQPRPGAAYCLRCAWSNLSLFEERGKETK